MKFSGLVFFSLLISTQQENLEQCERDGVLCDGGGGGGGVLLDETLYEAYEFKKMTSREDFLIRDKLDKIDEIKSGDPAGALKKVQALLKIYPDSPRALNSLARIYRILYNKLSKENKEIGRIEYLNKLKDIVIKIVKMPCSKLPIELFKSVADFGVANSQALGERDWTIMLVEELVFGPRNPELDAEDKEFYFQTLLDEKFCSGDISAVKQLIIDITKNGTTPSMSMRFLMGIITRIEEKNSDLPFKPYNEAVVDQTKPTDQQERDELYLYSQDLEKELRREEKVEMINLIHDFLVELSFYPSRYQRPITNMNGLSAKPIWTLEETEYEDKLYELEENWETIRDEALKLVENTPPQNITLGEPQLEINRRWKQYFFHGNGAESFPEHICNLTPLTCSLLRDYMFATRCPLGSIKLTLLEPGAYIQPHVGGHNLKLRAHLPLLVPSLNATEPRNSARMVVAGVEEVVWEEGKIVVFDDSFEHEIWNLSSQPRLILVVDLLHPDMTQEQFAEAEAMFNLPQGAPETGVNMAPVQTS